MDELEDNNIKKLTYELILAQRESKANNYSKHLMRIASFLKKDRKCLKFCLCKQIFTSIAGSRNNGVLLFFSEILRNLCDKQLFLQHDFHCAIRNVLKEYLEKEGS